MLEVNKLKHSLKQGFSFGLTSAVITTLGMIVGLHSSTNLKIAVIGGIVAIAIADAFSDAMGIHISEEAENKHTAREVWAATLSTFFCKFVFALTFIIPVVLLDLSTAIIVAIAWGLSLLAAFSYYMARQQGTSPWKVILEHLGIAGVVIVITHYVGDWVATLY